MKSKKILLCVDHRCEWASAGVLNIDFRLVGSYVIADLQSGYLTNKIPTATIFTINSTMLIIRVNMHMPFYRFSQLFHTAAQYIIHIRSVTNEKAIRYHSLVFCWGSLQSHSKRAKPNNGKLQSGLSKYVKIDSTMITKNSLLAWANIPQFKL